ncbi:MAG: amino acid--tRNA ligase-related protein, partial [Candidatus Roizmanbacteria bacterium]|nr:amino acid--tRNA ligase-related protein [Candidatus Roizmanbacteria bacterium]
QMSNHIIGKSKHFPRFSLELLFEKICGKKLSTLSENDSLLRKIAKEKGFTVERNTSWQELYDQLFVSEIEPTLPQEPVFLTDFPARISPLCAVQKNNPFLVDRFELYIHGIELANGNTESTDTRFIRTQFEKEHKTTGMPIDEDFLNSLERMKGSTYAGVGLGIDRLAMMYVKNESIHSNILE